MCLRRLMIDRTTISAIAAELGVSWHTVNTIAMRATADLVAAAGPDRRAGGPVRHNPCRILAGPRPGQINAFADAGDILAVSRCVNGWIEGRNPVGWDYRRTRYLNCMAIGDQLLTVTTATPGGGEDELSAEAERMIRELHEAFLLPTDSLSPLRKPGEGKIAPLVRFLRYIDSNTHVPLVVLLAEMGHPDILKDLKELANIDLEKYPDRVRDAELAQQILADVATPKPLALAVKAANAQPVSAAPATTAALVSAVQDAVARVEPKIVYAAAPEPAAPQFTGTPGQIIGQAYDAISALDLSADLPPEAKATLAALLTILQSKIGNPS
jgi:hypothetical protein